MQMRRHVHDALIEIRLFQLLGRLELRLELPNLLLDLRHEVEGGLGAAEDAPA